MFEKGLSSYIIQHESTWRFFWMNLAEYSSCDGIALAELVRKREVSPKELAQLFVEAVEKINPEINAVIEVYFDSIKQLDDQAISAGPLAGVPFLMKDIGAGEGGRLQESGSRLMKEHIVDKDSFLTTLFKGAGLTIMGRTTTPEFALGISTESELMGATRNPWNLAVTRALMEVQSAFQRVRAV
jgi:amidase